jgi:hypothetical protein
MPFVRFGIVPGLIEPDEQRNTFLGSIFLLWSGGDGLTADLDVNDDIAALVSALLTCP